jgi:iron complex outermembrane receptor protein
MDLRLAYRPREHIELAVVGQNLLDSQHLEYGYSASVPRGIYGTVTWRR